MYSVGGSAYDDEKPGPSSRISSSASSSDLRKALSGGGGGTTGAKLPNSGNPAVVEDEIDQRLALQDGLIHRPKDPKMCRHGDLGRCVFCLPLEPYDESYLREHNIKHLSFHSYIKKLTQGDK